MLGGVLGRLSDQPRERDERERREHELERLRRVHEVVERDRERREPEEREENSAYHGRRRLQTAAARPSGFERVSPLPENRLLVKTCGG